MATVYYEYDMRTRCDVFRCGRFTAVVPNVRSLWVTKSDLEFYFAQRYLAARYVRAMQEVKERAHQATLDVQAALRRYAL